MTTVELMQIFTGFLGTLGFSVLFHIRGKRLVMAALGGFISWLLFVLLGNVISSEPIRYFIVSLVTSFYAEWMARLLKTPTTTFLMTTLIPLVPGASLYYTMAYALGSDMEKFIQKAISTLKLAGALALGIVIATMIVKIMKTKGDKQNGSIKTISCD
jgi:uncharacterized membrane protein YjjB (DUF3815 family)